MRQKRDHRHSLYNFFPKNRKAAIELSIGTIVTIVLSVSFLVLGIFLIQRIGKSSTGVVDLTDAQLRDELNKLFAGEDKLIIYPQTKFIEIKQEETNGVGIGIRNTLQGAEGNTEFEYEVLATEADDCGVSETEAESWIITGQSEDNIPIASGDLTTDKVLFRIPVGAPLCIAKFRVNVYSGNHQIYDSDSFNIEIKAK